MNIIYTDHAKERMRQRKIYQKDIKDVIRKPNIEILRKDNTTILQSELNRGTLEIICKKSHTTCVIITCYLL